MIEMNRSSRKGVNTIIQQILVQQPKAESIREYLKLKKTAKDKNCLCIFLLYLTGAIIILGISLFYGNYSSIGTFVVNTNGNTTTICQSPTPLVNYAQSTCTSQCTDGTLAYLQKVCLSNPNITFNSSLIQIYTLRYCFGVIVILSIGLTALTALIYFLIMRIPKIIYFYIAVGFCMLLGLAFYILKFSQIGRSNYTQNSIFSSNQNAMSYISYLLISIELVLFPCLLFSSGKIKLGVLMLQKLKRYYKDMMRMSILTLLVVIVVWGLLILQIFIVLEIFTAGTPTTSNSLFLYEYTGVSLSNPAVLIMHFFGAYWIFCTIVSLHQHFVSQVMNIWSPIRVSLKKTYKCLGSAALDSVLMPLQWLLLLIFAICKIETEDSSQVQKGCMGSLQRLRVWLNKMYFKINRNCYNASIITNTNYFSSCQAAATQFAVGNNRFFNVGGSLTLFLGLFSCSLWILVSYITLNSLFYQSVPPPISNLVLPMVTIFLMSLVLSSLIINLFTVSLDTLLFCFLIEKKTGASQQRQICKLLQQKYIETNEGLSNLFDYQIE